MTNQQQNKKTISGYLTTRNCVELNYPFDATIKSLLTFCDEVVVGDSSDKNDGTQEILQKMAEEDSRIKVFHKDINWNAPNYGIYDGQMKAFARSKCTKEILVQMDADEVFDDSAKDKFPSFLEKVDWLDGEFQLAALPVVEYWGSPDKARLDVNPWKWRVSKNVKNITHGIPGQLRHYKDGLLYARQGSDGCVTPDTKIMTINGEKRIDEINEGELVYTHNGRFKKVTKVFKRPNQKWNLYSISCREYINDTLQITSNHPFLLMNNEKKIRWHNIDDGMFSKNDYFVFPKLNIENKNEIVYSVNNREIKPNNNIGFLIGLFLGDGNVVMRTENKEKFNFLAFSLSLYQDDVVKKVEKIFKDEFGQKISKTRDLKKNYWSIRIHNNKIAEFFYTLCKTGSKKKKIDPSIFSWNNDAIEGLLEGLYQSDGADCRSGINITMINGALLSQIKTLLTKIDLYPSLKSYKKISGFSKKEIEMYQLRLTGEQTSKINFLVKSEKKQKQHFIKTDKYFGTRIVKKSNEIKEIIYDGILYNLEVEEDHSYIANGITVHKCDYIDSVTLDIIPCLNFISNKVTEVRVKGMNDQKYADAYQKWFQHIVDTLPTIHHYSWWNIGEKIKKFRGFWNNSWLTLYGIKNDKPEGWNPFFANKTLDEVTDLEIKELSNKLATETGGHIFHSPWNGEKTNHVKLNISQPKVIIPWAEKNKQT